MTSIPSHQKAQIEQSLKKIVIENTIYLINRRRTVMEYKYMNDYEREQTQKYEGIYTDEEVELNKRLYEECSKENIDFALVEDLLKQGADPLGATATHGWDLLTHVYGELVCESQDNDSIHLPRLTELFLKYGMDIDNPRIPYDFGNSINPMWCFAFLLNENSIVALKMLLDNQLSAESFGIFWSHCVNDLGFISNMDPISNSYFNRICTNSFKMAMLGASYDHILSQDDYLQRDIGCSDNNYDLHKFREPDDFYYEFDTSNCTSSPQLDRLIIRIREVSSKKEVWKIIFCV